MSESNLLDLDKMLNLLGPQGRISQHIKNFESREQQNEMLDHVIQAYNKNQIALIEAGTGTGKSMAYLLPAIAWSIKNHERTLISTNTIALQEQLLHKDIPILVKALGVSIKAVIVKGMSNYVCQRKLADVKNEFALFSEEEYKELQIIDAWCEQHNEQGKNGSRAELPIYPSQNTWERVKAENDLCNHNNCPNFKTCYFFTARKQAEEANILIGNHHLLLADIACRGESEKGEGILPAYDRVIIDEAHNLEEIASEAFANKISRRDLFKVINRIAAENVKGGTSKLSLLKEKIYKTFSMHTSADIISISTKLNIDIPGMRRDLLLDATNLFETLHQFHENSFSEDNDEQESVELKKFRLKKEHETNPYWQDEVSPRLKKFCDSILSFCTTINGLEADLTRLKNEKFDELTKTVRFELINLTSRLHQNSEILSRFAEKLDDPERVRWLENEMHKVHQNINLIDADLDITPYFVNLLFKPMKTVILCSATLTTNNDFKFTRKRLGLDHPHLKSRGLSELILSSPFNYQKQALFAVPSDMPQPSDENFISTATEKIWEALQVSRGGAFVLFTSYQMLQMCYQILSERLNKNGFTVFKQGDDQRRHLLEKFRTTKKSVLFGTSSFWEGVDVVGDALRCVILVKLPFKVPSEPLLAARCEKIQREGGNWFMDYMVPQAIVKFKQGFGRLIRNKQDRGCIICLDVRLVNKPYGSQFIKSLPSCKLVLEKSEVIKEKMAEFYRKTYHLTLK